MTEHHFKRPEVLHGYTLKANTPCGTLYTTLNEHENKLREVRITLGKSGTCYNILFQTIAILISVMLQDGMSKEKIKKTLFHQFEGSCGQIFYIDGDRYNSCMHFIINRILEDLASRGEICLEEKDPV